MTRRGAGPPNTAPPPSRPVLAETHVMEYLCLYDLLRWLCVVATCHLLKVHFIFFHWKCSLYDSPVHISSCNLLVT